MGTPHEDRVRQLQQALAKLPPSRWTAFLLSECGEDTDLGDEVLRRQRALTTSQIDEGSPPALLAGPPPPVALDDASATVDFVTPSGLGGTEFGGNERFLLRRRLGAGAFGVVYEARDASTNTIVALKTLQRLTSDSLFRFKREFRSLVDVSHRNLVQFYELTSHENHWFFTMELVEGCHFLEHVSERPSDAGGTFPGVTRARPVPVENLVPAVRQLIDGLGALHRSGHVHRDIKPSNVLVARDGRVVVVDFGLVIDVDPGTGPHSMIIAGTPAYMSPEQAAGLRVTPASDWYSVGVMLYQALTGALPFAGSYLQVLTDKQRLDPPRPRLLVGDLPDHLDALCHDLLNRDAAKRPSEDEIRLRLDSARWRDSEGLRVRNAPRAERQRFVGRGHHLGTLDEAFRQVLAGAPTLATVFGQSGIGKSALLNAFLERIRQVAPEAVTLTGRCYERESVPYKALDSFIDSLARYLSHLPSHEARAVLPREIDSIAQLFPVMRTFHQGLARRVTMPRDAQELRRRACAALRDLLGRLGDAHPLIVVIDDLQWGDVDSATLLADVMRPPDAPVALFVAVYRDIEIRTSPFLRTFLADDVTQGQSLFRIRVGPLDADESQELAAVLASRLTSTLNVVSLIAAESGGSPFFIGELVRFAETDGAVSPHAAASRPAADSDEREATLAHMMQIRLSRLPTVPQRLLRLAAVNGRPVPGRVLKSAAGDSGSEGALALLRSEHLLRARDTDRGVEFEAYHDRIREIVVATLDAAAVRECHELLASAFEGEAGADAELLAQHWLGAGDMARAAHYNSVAAAEAEEALAFDRAARLYQRAVDLLSETAGGRGALMASVAMALANAGRCAEAAAVYLAIPTSRIAEALDFKQKAAQQLLFGGHIDEGLRVVREVLHAVGMTLPESRAQTLSALLSGRLRVRMRGLRYREREAHAISPDELMKVDACWAVSAGLAIVDTMRGAVFQTRHLLLALRAGEVERVHRALCLEAVFAATRGPRTARRVRRIQTMTGDLAQRIGTSYAAAMNLLNGGVCDYLVGRWTPAAAALGNAEQILTDHCTGVTWEVDCSRLFGLWSLYQLGELKTIAARFPILLKDAFDRGDLYAATTLGGLHAHIVYLALGDPEAASRHTRDTIARWPSGGFRLPQLWELWSLADIAIYEGHGIQAWANLDRTWPALRRSLLMEVQLTRVSMVDLRGRVALAAAHESGHPRSRQRFVRIALECAKAMERQRVEWASALALMIRAGAEQCRGRDDLASPLFDRAHATLVTLDMRLLATVALRRHGELTGGAIGSAKITDSDAWMRSQGIRDPEAFARMLAPTSAAATH